MLTNQRGTVAIPRDKIVYIERGTYYDHESNKYYRVNAVLMNCSETLELARYTNIEDSKKEMKRIMDWMSMEDNYKPKGEDF